MAHIKTYARIKPSFHPFVNFDIFPKVLSLQVPYLLQNYGCFPGRNHSSTSYDFHFYHVFDVNSTQEDIFDDVAKNIVDGFLNGYNGTIFAFGQTGSGKTYTMEGGSYSYKDRGITPRVLSAIYKYLEKRENDEVTIEISYLEIYQEVAYDLLNSAALNSFSPVIPLSKISVVEGVEGTYVMRNLSLHLAADEEVAQCLLLRGQSNRKVAETPVNHRSSRSHGVFTIYLTSKTKGSDVTVKSKLHLVDLAGSERVSKTGVDGQQLTEAKSINLSLHHLESVIIALQEDNVQSAKHRQTSMNKRINFPSSPTRTPISVGLSSRHIPYRNSLLTMILRDSLGGNCLTAMVATVSLECDNLGESISTSRFAQRVACISNHVKRNEEIDDQTTIRNLRKRVAELETEVACLKLIQNTELESQLQDMSNKLTDEDKMICSQVVQDYIQGKIHDPISSGITTPYRFRECLKLLKRLILDKPTSSTPVIHRAGDSAVTNYFNSESKQPYKIPITSKNTIQQSQEKQNGRKLAWNANNDNKNPVLEPKQYTDTASSNNSIQYSKHVEIAEMRNEEDNNNKSSKKDLVFRTKSHTNSRKYNSPYEQQRKKEIVRLSKSIQSIEVKKLQGEKEIKVMKEELSRRQIFIQSLQLSRELEVVKKKITNQQNYIVNLKNIDTDDITLQQEALVEQLLQRKESKIIEKLRALRESGEESTEDEEGEDTQADGTKEVEIEDKFGQYRKRDGSLNTRQVFEMLKKEEGRKKKAAVSIEREKMATLSEQLELKEIETRQKLHDLKAMFKQSKSQGQPNNDRRHPTELSTQYGTEDSFPVSGPLMSLKHKQSQSHEHVDVRKSVLENINLRKMHLQSNSDHKLTQNRTIIPKTTDKKSLRMADKNKQTVDTVIPSEYIYNLGSATNFDANKMGFTSTNFDSALTAMLEKDVVCSDSLYNQFARPSRSSQSLPKQKSECTHVQKNMDDATKLMLTWGKASKNIPVSVRLDRLFENLDSDSTLSTMDVIGEQRLKEQNQPPNIEENSVTLDGRSEQVNTLSSPRSCRLTSQSSVCALSDKQCEKSYLSKAQMERNRVSRIRKAQDSANIIQRAWRKYQKR